MRGLHLLLVLLTANLVAAAMPGRFMQYPAIHNDTIVFTYEGDLWTVSAQGGTAARLTSHPGTESAAQFSPDGRQIAFSANYDAGTHVYVMPVEGGPPKRLTWQHNGAHVLGWTPDNRVIFRASVENTYRPIPKLFTVSVNGEMPEKLPVPNGVLCSYASDGKKIAYCPRGNEEYYWKRYKGGQYQEIWQYEFESNKFKRLTDYVGKNSYPMWVGDKLYFVSDRDKKGIANIYRHPLSNDKATAITHYDDFDVQMASTDGRRIVYLHSGYLCVLDCESGESREVNVRIPTDEWKLADRTINPRDYT